MIEVAVILSGAVRHWPDFFIILVLLLANGVVGYSEEHQAGSAIAALEAKLAITARVRRDGRWATPPAREVVPGDVIRLRLGDIVPADARLLDGDEISVDQSSLTGESLPVTSARGCGLLGIDHSTRRDRCARLRHGHPHVFRQDGRACPGRAHGEPLPEGRPQDR